MRTIEKTVYRFDELSYNAKERARNKYREHIEYPWYQECIDSLNAFAKRFDMVVHNYCLGGSDNYRNGVKWDSILSDEQRELSSVRLWRCNGIPK